jgi:spore protease
MNRTDLAVECEGMAADVAKVHGLRLSRVSVGKSAEKTINKPAGDYYTLYCPDRDEERETQALCEVLSRMIGTGQQRALVAGLGNENITPDSLGVRTANRVCATAHFSGHKEFRDLEMNEVYVIETGVLAQTGIESAKQLKYIADGIKPDIIIVIDSLACSETHRLARTIQLTESGIAPGSGVKNARQALSADTMGTRVLAIGVPTVIDLASLTDDETAKSYTGMVVPRDIDLVIRHFSKVISRALNRTLNPSLTDSELEGLLF